MRWLEVSLTASAENAEAVADVLARFAPGGTVISGEPGGPQAPMTVRAYLAGEQATPELERRLREAIWHLSQIAPLPEPALRWLEAEDWAESWRQHFHPVFVGRRLAVIPAWMRSDDPSRLPVYLDPGMAFGTGAHPTTRLCLEALETYLRPGDLVVDVGCGSGILGFAALRLGAAGVLACDTDPVAIESTRRGAELNGVTGIDAFPGSLAETARRLAGRPGADIVVANLTASILTELLAQGLADLARPAGLLILSGILTEQRPDVVAAATAAGLAAAAESAEQDWCALVYRNDKVPLPLRSGTRTRKTG